MESLMHITIFVRAACYIHHVVFQFGGGALSVCPFVAVVRIVVVCVCAVGVFVSVIFIC